jgi:radical SAM protein with 4Fe4S-binding SPASM domain
MSVGAPDFDHMVYVRLLEACNLHCQHCFIPNNPKRMSWEDLAAIPGRIRSFARPGQTLLFQFHGGEPTLIGVELMRRVIDHFRSELSDYVCRFSLQTNLMTYDLTWAGLYRDAFDKVVGVSWDPDIRLMRAGRSDSNVEFEKRFWTNLGQLQLDGLTPYMVITVTKPLLERFRNPDDLIAFLEEKRIRYAHFEKLTKTGYAINNWSWLGVSNREYSMWVGRFAMAYQRYVARPRSVEQPLHISPLDGLIDSVKRLRVGGAGGYGCLSGTCDTRFHTFDQDGYYSACTALTSEISNKNSVGVAVVDPTKLVEVREDRQRDCQACRFKPICSSGCIATPRLDDSGECSGGFLAFKVLNDHLASLEVAGLIAVAG